jgi:hypothetical protein
MAIDEDETFVDPRITATTQTLAPAPDVSITATIEPRTHALETAEVVVAVGKSEDAADDDATLRDALLHDTVRSLPEASEQTSRVATASEPKAVRFVVKKDG